MRLLADKLVDLHDLEKISDETVQRTPGRVLAQALAAGALVFDSAFVAGMENVLNLYVEFPESRVPGWRRHEDCEHKRGGACTCSSALPRTWAGVSPT